MTVPAQGLPSVSVAMINRDYGRYLAAAVTSALEQDIPAHEVVVVDDGSSDESMDVLRRLEDRVTVIATRPRGKGAATTDAVNACTGDVVALLDSDDLMRPSRVSELAGAYARQPEAQWVWHRLDYVDRDTMAPYPVRAPRHFYPGEHDHRPALRQGRIPITTPATSALSWRRPFLQSLLPLPPDVRSQDNYLKALTMALAPGYVLDATLSTQGLHGANLYSRATGASRRLKGAERTLDLLPALADRGLEALHRRLLAEVVVTTRAGAALTPTDRDSLRELVAARPGVLLAPLAVALARRARQATRESRAPRPR